jgi:hypothetical protein
LIQPILEVKRPTHAATLTSERPISIVTVSKEVLVRA